MPSSSYMPLSGSILEDLAALQDQSTESLTEALYACHQAHRVYTHCGAVIVALNPFENVPNLYGPGVQRQFHDTAPPKQRPHVYAVGENAYNALLSGDRRNQTIVITGESGSGKTISCNHIIDYLAARGQAETGLSAKLTNAGAVLEAFGNAPTARNHNSSRYAKVVNIHFGPNGGAMGASVSTFLLERGRVTDENPFHIITALREIDTTGKSERFDAVCEALLNVGIDMDAQERVWEILRGIDCLMRADDVGASNHFGIDAFKLREAIRNRTVKVGADVFNKQREGAELQAARHGLVRSLYVWMFEWLVEKINVALGAPSDDHPCVSLVDIFGFESFDERNSLAQFLINWANEQLLCHLSEDMLEHEADQYAAEGIKVDRPPKLPSCLPLLVGTPGSRGKAPQPGISSLLDDETRRLGLGMKNVTDEGFARNVAIECNHHHGYVRALAAHEFKVAHYAATVAYDSRGFLAANSERVDVKLLEALAKTDNFVRDLVLSKLPSQSSPRRDPFTSVVTSFRQSIQKLDALLANTRVHYVHCIKPNEHAKPRVFEHDRVQMQMEATGVAHISRFARAHGPLKIPREDMPVYALLLGAGFADADLSCVVAKLNEFAGDPDGRGVQLGSKHIFFRSTAMERIQDALEPKLAGLRQFQSAARAYLARSSFRATRSAVVRVQALARGRAARAEFQVRLAEARAAAKAAAEKAAAERAAAERAAAEKAAAEKAAAEKAAAEKSATRLAAENVSNRTKTPDAKLTPKPETRALDVVDANRPAELTPDTTASDRTTPVAVPVTPKGEFTLSHSDSFLLDNFEHPSVNVDTVDIVDGGLDTTRSSFDLSSSDHASSVLGSILDDYDETSSSMQTSAGQHDPPPEMLRDLAGSPFTDSSSTSILISSLLAGATDCDSAARVGIVLGSVVRWYDAAKLRYVPEVLANEFLRSALPAVRRQRDVPQLWCIAIMAHAFCVQLSSTHVLLKQLERLQETALDLVLQGVYSVAEETISAALAPDSARKMSAGRPLLDTLWGEMSQFSDVVRDVTGRTILDRMFQHLIARILTKKIREQNATHVLASLGWVFEWRDEVGLAPSRIENIAMLMLHWLAGFDVDGDAAEVEDFTISMEKLLSRTHSSQPTKAANAALRAIADEAPVDLSAELGHALSLVEVYESAGDAANHLGEHIISKKPVYTFLAWVGRVAAG